MRWDGKETITIHIRQELNFLRMEVSHLLFPISQGLFCVQLTLPTGAYSSSSPFNPLLISIALDARDLQLRIGISHMKRVVVFPF